MDGMRKSIVTLLCLILIFLPVGCAPSNRQPATAQTSFQVSTSVGTDSIPATGDNLGLYDALVMLKLRVEGLGISSFAESASWGEKKQKMVDDITAAMEEAQRGAYDGVASLLQDEVTGMIEKAIVGDEATKLRALVKVVEGCISNAAATTVEVRQGRVAGAAGYLNSWVWKGIPYARPPVGEMRWRAPADPAGWSGVRHSTDAYEVAVQKEQSKMWVPTGRIVGSEDCLYLNIWRPRNERQKLPVYFWIHGGGNTFGTGKLYDGSALAIKSDLIVVTIQYRLGALGWLNHPALKVGVTPEEASGNFGLLDIIKALQWVHENIGAFGGDPDNITVAGESAGGHDTLDLLVSPLADGLFHRAICESAGMRPITVEEGIAKAANMIENLLLADGKVRSREEAAEYRRRMTENETAGYLRSKKAEDIIRAETAEKMTAGFHPAFIDGVVMPDSWLNVIASGRYNRVPVIIGSNEYELKPFQPLLGAVIPTSSGHRWSDLYAVLDGRLKLDDVLAGQFDRDLYEACGYYGSRYWKASSVDSVARQLKTQQDNVWVYFFKWGGVGSGPTPYDFIIGAGHATEIPFFFGWSRDTFGYAFTEQNKVGRQALQKAMMSYAAQFIRTGDPDAGGGDLPRWETWSNEAGAPKCIVFDATYTDARIGMMSEEVTADGVRAEVESLPPLIKQVVKLWIQ